MPTNPRFLKGGCGALQQTLELRLDLTLCRVTANTLILHTGEILHGTNLIVCALRAASSWRESSTAYDSRVFTSRMGMLVFFQHAAANKDGWAHAS
jgi:hypothetical protein